MLSLLADRLKPACWVCVAASALVVCWAVFVCVVAWPGLFAWDSVEQALQGFRFDLTNGHPPAYSLMLGGAARAFGTPAALLPLQLALLAGGLVALVWIHRTAAVAVGVVLLALLPNLWTLAIAHLKDVWVVIGLVWWLVLYQGRRPWASLAPLVAMVLFRHNAIALAGPLAVLSVFGTGGTLLRRGVVVTITSALLLVVPGALSAVVGARDVWPVGFSLVHDAAALYKKHPFEYRRGPMAAWNARAAFTDEYSACSVWRIVNSTKLRRVTAAELPEVRHEVAAEWWRLVRAHPTSWWQARMRHFKCLLRIGHSRPFKPYQIRSLGGRKSPWPIPTPDSTAWRALNAFREWAANQTPLFLPKWWLLAAPCVLVAAALRRRLSAVVLVVAGLCYELTYLFAGPAAEHRYSVPFEIALVLAILVIIGRTRTTTASLKRPEAPTTITT